MTEAAAQTPAPPRIDLARLAPGIALSLAVALASFALEPLLKSASGGRAALPSMVIALILGVTLHGVANRALFQPGMVWCVKVLLRYAIGLLGLRIALGDIAAL